MKIWRLFIALGILIMIGLSSACEHEPIIPEETRDTTKVDTMPIDTTGNDTTGMDTVLCDSTSLSYALDVVPIISTTCAVPGCHVATGGNGIPYESYAQLKAKVDNGSLENRVLHLMEMPQGDTLTPCEIAIFRNWVLEGAPQ